MDKQKGISQITVMIMMLVLAIALPITTKLVQQSQENRSRADVGGGGSGGGGGSSRDWDYPCSQCSANYGCKKATFTSSTLDCSSPIGSVDYSVDCSCPKRNGAGGGNDDTCTDSCETKTDTCSTVHPGGSCGSLSRSDCTNGTKYIDDHTCMSNSSSDYQCCVPAVDTGSDEGCANIGGTCRWITNSTCGSGYTTHLDGGLCTTNSSSSYQCCVPAATTEYNTAYVYYLKSSNECKITDAIYSTAGVDSAGRTCAENLNQYLNGKTSGVCYSTTEACEDANVVTTCTSFNYSAWSPANCTAGSTQTRTVTSEIPAGCTGGNVGDLSRSCPTTVTTCTSFNYSAWSPANCTAGSTQTRTVTSEIPAGCTGGNVGDLSRSCPTAAVNGACSTTKNTCTAGTLSDTADTSTQYKWNCVGTNGGTTANCTANITAAAGDSTVNIKLALAGVKLNNGQCATNWPVALKIVDSAGNNVMDKVFSGVPTQTTSVNSKGEIIYDFNIIVSGVPEAGVNKLAFFLTGSKHIPLKYGKNNQTGWYSTLAGDISLTKGTTNSFDFSKYPLLAGDVTGDTAGTPDGKIDGRDFSYIKEKANALASGSAGTSVAGDIDGNCQVNSGDVRLVKESLIEINGQTY